MGEVAALRAELDQAREESNRVILENERLIDEKDAIERRVHSVADAKLTQMEESFETRIAQARAEASHKVETIRRELEQLRRAASGDSCGWEENKNGTFSNIETGETGVTTIPEALAFARAVQRIDDLGNQEETAKMSQKLAKQSETKRRELDIKLNEARADARAQREILANWVSTAKTIETSFSSHLSCLNSTCGALNLKDAFLAQKNNVLRRSLFRVNHAVASLKELRDALKLAEASKASLESRVHQLQVSFKDTQQELDSLRNSLTSAVETEVKPIRLEICKARDALSRERLARMVERRQFAALWPSGHLAPMALRLHVDASGSKRQILLNAACIAAADAEIKREIRRRVADASRWSQKADDYGRMNRPLGVMNSAIVLALIHPQGCSQKYLAREKTIEGHKLPVWEKMEDEWGQTSWKDKSTGNITWTKPPELDKNTTTATEEQQASSLTDGHIEFEIPQISDDHNETNLSSDDESAPIACDSAATFLYVGEKRCCRLEQQRRRATMAARIALAFLEETALGYRARLQAYLVGDEAENDAPAFVDAHALRVLAAGDDGWRYISRSERKVGRIRAEATRIAFGSQSKVETPATSRCPTKYQLPAHLNTQLHQASKDSINQHANTSIEPTILHPPLEHLSKPILSDGNIPLDKLRSCLETTALHESNLSTQLLSVHRRVEAISYGLLSTLDRSHLDISSPFAHKPTSHLDRLPLASEDFCVVHSQLALLRSTLQPPNEISPEFKAGYSSCWMDMTPSATHTCKMKTMLQILAAELVLSGLDDRPVLSRCSVAGNYDPAVAIDISPLVQALDANIDIDHKDGSFIETASHPGGTSANSLDSGGNTSPLSMVSHQKTLLSIKDATFFLNEVAQLLDKGKRQRDSIVQLALADVPNQQPGCSPLGFTKSQESDCRVPNSKFTSSLKKNGPLILMESVITHEGALGSLLTQSTQLNAAAWIDHKACSNKLSLQITRLRCSVTRHKDKLSDANRHAQDAQALLSALEGASEQSAVIENHKLVCGDRYEDITRETMHSCRAIEALAQIKVEARAEYRRGEWLLKRARYSATVRASQIVERARQARALVWLQHCLKVACTEHNRTCLAHKLNKNTPIDRVIASRLRCLNILEQLRREGRHRRSLQEMELLFFRSEIRRLLNDHESQKERISLLESISIARVECDHVPIRVPFVLCKEKYHQKTPFRLCWASTPQSPHGESTDIEKQPLSWFRILGYWNLELRRHTQN